MRRNISAALSCAALFAAVHLLSAPVSAQAVITKNTKELGFVDLPGGTNQGLWAYEDATGRYCLQTRASSGVAIVDMTNPTKPKLVSNYPGSYRKVQVWQHYMYVTSDSTPLTVVDISNVANPTFAGTVPVSSHTLRVDESNGRLYLNKASGLFIYDVATNPADPQLLGIWPHYAHDSRPDGDLIFVNGFAGIPTRILDVSDPANPTEIGTVPTGNHSSDLFITPSGDRVLVTCDEKTGGHVNLYNVNDIGNPQFLSKYQTMDTSTSVHNVEIKGAYAYVAYYQDQLRVLDISDVNAPAEVGIWDNNVNNTGGTYSDAWEAIPDHDAVYMGQMSDTSASPRGVRAIDFFPGYGTGSQGAAQATPEAWWSYGPATPGNNRFALRLTNAAPNAPAWLILGISNTSWAGGALPQAMDAIGAPNARLAVSPDFLFPVTTDADGNASLPLPIPASFPFFTFYVQWIVRDTGAPNPGGWAFSKAGTLHIY